MSQRKAVTQVRRKDAPGLEEVVRRLDLIVALMLESSQENNSVFAKIRKLRDLGVSPADTARILGKPLNYVTAALAQQKSKAK